MNHNALNDQQIDSLIADALGVSSPDFSPCSNIADAWPIIQQYSLALIPAHDQQGCIAMAFPAILTLTDQTIHMVGSRVHDLNPQRAAMLALLKARSILQLDS